MRFQLAAILSLVASGALASEQLDKRQNIPSSLLELATSKPAEFISAIQSEFASGIPTWLPSSQVQALISEATSAWSDVPQRVSSLTSGLSIPSGISSLMESGSARLESITGGGNSVSTDSNGSKITISSKPSSSAETNSEGAAAPAITAAAGAGLAGAMGLAVLLL